jgi:hypothetical protein
MFGLVCQQGQVIRMSFLTAEDIDGQECLLLVSSCQLHLLEIQKLNIFMLLQAVTFDCAVCF